MTLDDPLDAALTFVARDGSYQAYDLAPVAADDTLTEQDVRTANRIIARMGAPEITAILSRREQVEAALAAIPTDASLTSAVIPWRALGDLYQALEGLPRIGLPRITKVLHKKRPALIPILDSVVEQYLIGVGGPVGGTIAERAVRLTQHYKSELDATIDVLQCVKSALAQRSVNLTECRLLDVYVWALSGTHQPMYQREPGAPAATTNRPRPARRQLPAIDGVVVFKDDDPGYLAWLRAHPAGFVVNCGRQPAPSYLKLHRADCSFISGRPTRGAKWTDQYLKACATSVKALREWATVATGGELSDCRQCH